MNEGAVTVITKKLYLHLHSCPVEVANMISLNIKHNELTAEEFILLWESVWGKGPSPEQTQLALEHTLFRVSVFDGNTIIAMARVIGDLGLDYFQSQSYLALYCKLF